MIDRMRKLLGSKTAVKRVLWRRSYQVLARRYPQADLQFMNYGYIPSDGESQPDLRPEDEPYRLHIQLYHRVLRDIDMRGRDVLEVGCGRGGGAAYVSRYHAPQRVVGVDFAEAGIAWCRRHHTLPGLTFVVGDAEALPVLDETFDAVINVESSHCYGSMPRFLSEVQRVLRPSGHLLLADLRSGPSVAALRAELRASGMTILREERINGGVLHSLERDSERRSDLIERRVPRPMRGLARMFAGIRGTPMYEWLQDGRAEYLCCVLEKRTVVA